MNLQPLVARAGAALVPVLSSVAFLLGPGHAPAAAQARERVMFVSAVDAAGKPVEQLTPADVRVREDGVAREVLRVTPASEPLQIALLVDNTAAIRSQVQDYRTALQAFVAKFPSPHEIAFITYGDRPTVVTEYSSGPVRVVPAIDRLFSQPNAGSYVLDAIQEAARGLQKREASRPVIVVVSSEGMEFSNITHDMAVNAVRAANASLFVVSVDDGRGRRESMGTQEGREREMVFGDGTTDTGGRREIVLSSMGLKDALTTLAEELLHQFKVVYARPSTLIPPEKTVVASAREGLTVRGALARTPAKGE